jgi:hypothetical protein
MKRLRTTPVEYLIKIAYKPGDEKMAMEERRGAVE